MSGGCGGGSSSAGGNSDSPQGNENQENGKNNSGWDTEPDNGNQNGNQNNNGNNNQGNNNGNNDNPNESNNYNGNENQNGNNGSPVTINGTWEIVSGHAVVSEDKRSVSLTYAGTNGEVGIEMVNNGNNYGAYSGLYTLRLTGENVVGTNGAGGLFVNYRYDDYPDRTYPLTFLTLPSFKYIGNGTYEAAEENSLNSGMSYRYIVTLENASTLHLYYSTTADTSHLGYSLNMTGWYDIYLRKVR